MVVHYPRTVWKNSYVEHEVTGKTYKNKSDIFLQSILTAESVVALYNLTVRFMDMTQHIGPLNGINSCYNAYDL